MSVHVMLQLIACVLGLKHSFNLVRWSGTVKVFSSAMPRCFCLFFLISLLTVRKPVSADFASAHLCENTQVLLFGAEHSTRIYWLGLINTETNRRQVATALEPVSRMQVVGSGSSRHLH
jgi:hypothetical protein